MIGVSDIINFVQQLEGPYKWYALAAILGVLTLFFTRFVFKTIKWFLMIVAIGVIIATVVAYFYNA